LLILYSITRDNASSNNLLLEYFKKHYNLNGYKFQGNIPCIAHILNLAIQDILKALIKDKYDSFNEYNEIQAIEEDYELNNSSKFLLLII
jgi:hypothetical protein